MEKVTLALRPTPPPHYKSVKLFKTVTGAASNTMYEITLTIPNNNSGAKCVDFFFQVTNNFDDMVINCNLYNFSIDQLYSAYQTVFWVLTPTKVTSSVWWSRPQILKMTMELTKLIYCTRFATPVAASDCLLHYMCGGKMKSMPCPSTLSCLLPESYACSENLKLLL